LFGNGKTSNAGISKNSIKSSKGGKGLCRGEKSYFDAGSVRNSARDEEFFNYFN